MIEKNPHHVIFMQCIIRLHKIGGVVCRSRNDEKSGKVGHPTHTHKTDSHSCERGVWVLKSSRVKEKKKRERVVVVVVLHPEPERTKKKKGRYRSCRGRQMAVHQENDDHH